jgi:hypothetical protein
VDTVVRLCPEDSRASEWILIQICSWQNCWASMLRVSMRSLSSHQESELRTAHSAWQPATALPSRRQGEDLGL